MDLGQAGDDLLAGLGVAVEVERREYDIQMTLAEFLSTREKSLNARFMKSTLGPEQWQRFWQDTVAEFERRFAEQIVFTRDVLIGTGTRVK